MKKIIFLVVFFSVLLNAKCIDKTFKEGTFLYEPEMTTIYNGSIKSEVLSKTTTLWLDWDKCWDNEVGQFKLFNYNYRNDLKDIVLIQYIYKLSYGFSNNFDSFVNKVIKNNDFVSKIKKIKQKEKKIKIEFILSFETEITYKVEDNKLILEKKHKNDGRKRFQ